MTWQVQHDWPRRSSGASQGEEKVVSQVACRGRIQKEWKLHMPRKPLFFAPGGWKLVPCPPLTPIAGGAQGYPPVPLSLSFSISNAETTSCLPAQDILLSKEVANMGGSVGYGDTSQPTKQTHHYPHHYHHHYWLAKPRVGQALLGGIESDQE